MTDVIFSVVIPLVGTVLGAGGVFFLKNGMSRSVQRGFIGFAAGVMVAASVWSLILPSMELSEGYGSLSFIPAVVGLILGFGFLMLLDRVIPHLHVAASEAEGPSSNFKRSTMMILAVALHNLPEGMAVGAVLAGLQGGESGVTTATALALAVGIAIQNFPEGAIISIPLRENGMSKKKSFFLGALSGAVEPLGALLTLLLAGAVIPALPYFLSFAAGAMLYVVVEELIPEMSEGEHSHVGTVLFAVGFMLMMVLDTLLG